MMKKTKYLILFLAVIGISPLKAQYQSATRIENYGGVNSIFLNPASSNIFPLRWDLNLVSADFYFDNSLGFISSTSLGDLSRNATDIKPAWQMESQANGSLVADFYRDTLRDKYVQISTTVNGPGFMFNTNGGQTIGAFYNFRVMAGTPRIPGSVNYYNYISQAVDDLIDFPSANFAFMAWDEIGLHFANRFATTNGYVSAGINAKYLRGYEAAYFNLNNDTEFRYLSTSQVVVSGLDFQYGFTNGNTNITDTQAYSVNPTGRGVGIDLGFNYVIEDDSDTYKLRLGASINDIGTVRFTENAEVHGLRGAQEITFDEATYQSFTTIEEVRDQASRDLFGSIGLSELDNPLKIGLPTTFSLQADYKIIEYVYASAVFINRVSFTPNSVKATNFISIAPRFEHRWGMASLPISLTEYQRLKVGAAFRLGYFIVGTDDLASITGTKEFRGTDVYFGIKVNPFSFGKSSGKGGRKGSNTGRGKVKCYKF